MAGVCLEGKTEFLKINGNMVIFMCMQKLKVLWEVCSGMIQYM
jgi:hypothetical protein